MVASICDQRDLLSYIVTQCRQNVLQMDSEVMMWSDTASEGIVERDNVPLAVALRKRANDVAIYVGETASWFWEGANMCAVVVVNFRHLAR